MEQPSEAVKQVLQMIKDGELTVEEVIVHAEEFSQDSNPFRKVVGGVYKQAIPFLSQSHHAKPMDQPVLYAIVPDTDDRWMVMVLLPNLEIEEYRPELSTEEEIRDLADMHPCVKRKYGDAAAYASAGVLKELQEDLRPWRFHSDEMLALLTANSLEADLSLFYVYGSRSRPMSATSFKAIIPGASFIHTDHEKTRYYTYVAVPLPLGKEQIIDYNLAIVSRFHFSPEVLVLLKEYEQAIAHDDGDDNHMARYIQELLDNAQFLGFTFVHNHALDAIQIVRTHPKQIIDQEENRQ